MPSATTLPIRTLSEMAQTAPKTLHAMKVPRELVDGILVKAKPSKPLNLNPQYQITQSPISLSD